ncbi:MAG: right-handed parallel beta-helix repeat-containing protein [bacterium]
MKNLLILLILIPFIGNSQGLFGPTNKSNITKASLRVSSEPTESTSADFYVSSSTGSDTNDGLTAETAWATIDKVNTESSTFVGGDTIAFKRGDSFAGTLTPASSGSLGNQIVYNAYGSGNKPVITGSEIVTGTWSAHSGNIYSIPYTATGVKQVFHDGVKLTAARYPNSSYHTITSVAGSTEFTSTDLDGTINYAGAIGVFRTEAWYLGTQTVSSSSNQTLTMAGSLLYSYNVDEGFFLMNHLEFLDQAGEWYHDGTTLYVWTPDGSSPSDNEIRATVSDECIVLSNVNYNKFEDLHLLHSNSTGVLLTNSDNITLDSVDIIWPGAEGVDITDSGTDYLTVTNCSIEGAGRKGIDVQGTYHDINNTTVKNTMIHDLIDLQGANAGQAINIKGNSNVSVTYCTIENTGYNGIHVYDSPNTTLRYNYILNSNLTIDDGGGIYLYENNTGVHSDNSIIEYNIIDNVPGNTDGDDRTTPYGVGIYYDEWSSVGVVENNTVKDVSQYGFYLHFDNHSVEARNNNFFNTGAGHRVVDRDSSRNNIIKQNNWLNTDNITYADGTGDLLGMMHPNHTTVVELDSNRYVDRHRVDPFQNTSTFTRINFSEWQTLVDDEANSTFDGTALGTNESDSLFYNATKDIVTYDLNGATGVEDIEGNTITTSFSLDPYTSIILTGTDLDLITKQ